MRKIKRGAIICAGLWLVTIGCPLRVIHAQQPRPGNLIDAARKDGEVVWYTTTSNEDNQAVVNGFT
jgi:hypothetical protein